MQWGIFIFKDVMKWQRNYVAATHSKNNSSDATISAYVKQWENKVQRPPNSGLPAFK
jgi:hypothetical protein